MNEIKELLWELKNVTKVFPGVKAINNLSLKIYSGEVHGMIGENGSGKSTIVKCLSGVYQPTSGKIFYRGNPIVIHDPMMACSLGVATIYQELSLVPSLTVAENIYIGRLPRKERFPFIVDWQEIVKKS
ncbi:MAG: ATP-binding cassette domain-containing protein, partial [Candidatus Scalindua sediminis]